MSFNRSAFNRTPFNRPYSADVFGNFELLVNGELLFNPSAEFTGSFTFDAGLETTFEAARERFGEFLIEQLMEINFAGIREKVGIFDLLLNLDMKFNANRNHVDQIEITGPIAPGDKIIIDAAKLLVKKNGQVIGYDGDIFDLNPGNNYIVYTDSETGRTIQVRITHRDRFI